MVWSNTGALISKNSCFNYGQRFCRLDIDQYTKSQPCKNLGYREQNLRYRSKFAQICNDNRKNSDLHLQVLFSCLIGDTFPNCYLLNQGKNLKMAKSMKSEYLCSDRYCQSLNVEMPVLIPAIIVPYHQKPVLRAILF